MSHVADPPRRAAAEVRAVRDAPQARLRLADGFYRSGTPLRRYRRAELQFLAWEISRGVIDAESGSAWWRAVNDRLLRDKVEAMLRHEAGTDDPGPPTVRAWRAFLRGPSPKAWYRAHNASIVAAYLDHEDLAATESPAERLMINVTLARVLYGHALVAAPRLALGRLASLGPRLGDPRGGSVGMFLDLRGVFPQRYPLTGLTVADIVAGEGDLPRVLDYGIIVPRLAKLYAFAADALDLPALTRLLRDGVPCYADLRVPLPPPGRARTGERIAAFLTAPGV